MAEQEPPEWLEAFLTAVAGCLSAELPETSLGVHYSPGEDPTFWQFDVFARPIELLGGEWDGEQVAPGFTVDLEELRGVFDRVDSSGWDNTGQEDASGPHLWIDGRYQGNQVLLRVLGEPPEGEEPRGDSMWATADPLIFQGDLCGACRSEVAGRYIPAGPPEVVGRDLGPA